jgi:hypothetical protein
LLRTCYGGAEGEFAALGLGPQAKRRLADEYDASQDRWLDQVD